eukprot:gene22706-30988_t
MKLSGPQGERDELWQIGRKSISKSKDRQDDIPLASSYPHSEKLIYENELVRVKGENDALRDQLKRALTELKVYQIKYPSPYQSSDYPAAMDEPEHSIAGEGSMTISYSYAAPLFEAYDIRIRELEDLAKQQNSKLDTFKTKIEILIKENEDLREGQLNKLGAAIPSSNNNINFSNPVGSSNNLSPSGPIGNELLAEMTERIEVLMDENALLVEQRSVMSGEIDKLQQRIKQCEHERSQLNSRLAQAHSEEQVRSARLSQAEEDREQAAMQAISSSEQLAKAENEVDILTEQLAICKQKNRESEAQMVDLRKQMQFLNLKTEDDGMASLRRVRVAEDRVRELHAQLLSKTQEADSASELLRKLRGEYASTRQDAEGMLQVMAGLERQLAEFAAREQQVERLARESKERSQEAQTAQDQAAVKEEQLRREVDSLLEQVRATEKDLDDMTIKNAQLVFEAEQAGREGKAAKDMLTRLKQVHEDERKAVQQALRSLGEQLTAANLSREQEASRRSEMQEQNKDLRLTVDKLRLQLDSLRGQQQQQVDVREKELAAVRGSLRDLHKEVAEKTRLLQRKTRELEERDQEQQQRTQTVQRRLEEEKDASAGLSADLTQQQLVQQLKDKFQQTHGTLETRLRMEQEQVTMLSQKLRASEGVVSDLTEEKALLVRALSDGRSQMQLLEEELSVSRGTIGDLTQQLALSHVAREDGAYRAARTMEELGLGSHPHRFSASGPPVRSSKDDLPSWISSAAISVPLSSSRKQIDEWTGNARLGQLKEEEEEEVEEKSHHPEDRDSAEGKNEEDEDEDEEGGPFLHSPSSGKGDPPHERNIFDISDEMG